MELLNRSTGYLAKRILFCMLLGLPGIFQAYAQLSITEIQASNLSTILDPTGNNREWIEIYNSGSTSIELDGYYLSTEPDQVFQYRIEDTRARAGKYDLVWINKDLLDPGVEFRLPLDGGYVALYSPMGELIDSMHLGPQFAGMSCGRKPGSQTGSVYYPEPSPGEANTNYHPGQAIQAEAVQFSMEGGFYEGPLSLSLSSADSGAVIRYTLDGSWPDADASLYTTPIPISSSAVVRAIGFASGKLPGPVTTHSYFLNDQSSLPVVSIVTDEEHFFDDMQGIYVEGENGITGRCMEVPVNWNQDWERPVNIEYYTADKEQVINQMAGVRISGGCSRMWKYKSLAIIARNKYGDNSLSHKFFASKEVDEFKAIVLRNSGNDAYKSMLRDGFMQSLLVDQVDVDFQGYQPANVFLNGEYWGILNVREKINEHYPASNYDLDSDVIDMLERERYALYGETVHGFGEHYQAMIDFVNANSMADSANFAHVKSQMDVEEYMNYYLVQIYFENEDWPRNNIKFWRPGIEGGKWRWVLYDTDLGWGLAPRSGNSMEAAATGGLSAELFVALLENDDFRHMFIQRMAALSNTTFHPDRVSPVYDSLLNQLNQEIHRHMDRWERPNEDTYLNHTLTRIPDFTENRPEIMRDLVADFFDIDGFFDLSAAPNDPAMGSIRAAGLRLPDNFTGPFFNDTPLLLEAIPESGYMFSHWEGASTSTRPTISLESSGDLQINAVFVPRAPLGNIHINEIAASNINGPQDEFGQHEDYIEIFNNNPVAVDVAGCFLSDSAELPGMYMIPYGYTEQTTIPAGGHLLIWCDGESRQGPLHTSFKLRRKGEFISLSQGIGSELRLLDSISYPKLQADLNYGRIRDSLDLAYMLPTPGTANEPGDKNQLYINEFLSKNCGLIRDEYGEADDWLEIYNPGPETVDLGGLFLTDSLARPLKYMIPKGLEETRLTPGEKLVFWADNQAEQGPMHLDFKLDGKNEQIGLYQIGHGYIDSLTYRLENSGPSYGRFPDGAADFLVVDPTPGGENRMKITEGLRINEFMANNTSTLSDEDGNYGDWVEIHNENDFPVDIGGLYLTDSLADPTKHLIPLCQPEITTIAAGGYLLLWADKREELGPLHLDFKLGAGGEEIGLVQADGQTFIDSLSYTEVESDMALGVLGGVEGNTSILSASPGAANHLDLCSGLYLSEFSASGNTSHADPEGEFDDWIEIYNSNSFAVNIAGMYLSDSLGDPAKCRISTRFPDSTEIAPGGYLVLWADNQEEQGLLHLDFKLSGKGEALSLTDIDGSTLIDSLSFPDQKSNFTYCRKANTGDWMFMRPTFMAFNENEAIEGIIINEVMASNSIIPDDHGDYDDWIELYNANDYPVDIGGLYLSDTLGDRGRYRIPSHSPGLTTMAGKSYLLLYADNTSEQGVLHTNFKLSSGGEALVLCDIDAQRIIDSLSFPQQENNFSYSRKSETGTWIQMRPTPMACNEYVPIQGIVINEFMSSNTCIADDYGEFDDWIELHNTNAHPVDLGGLYLSDSIGNPGKYRIPSDAPEITTIEAGGYLIFWADDDSDQGPLHTNFKLSNGGEEISLVQFDQESIIDSLSYGKQYKNASCGLLGKDSRWYILPPSPEKRNLIPDYSALRINEIMGYNRTKHHDEHNEYDDWIELYNAGDTDLDIGGMYLSDSLNDPNKVRISSEYPDSTTIGAGEYLILWADNSEEQGILHLGFKIDKTGESIGLFNQGNTLVDSITYPFISPNLSWGRSYGEHQWAIYTDPTPMQANMATGDSEQVLENKSLRIYPNPVRDRAWISFKQDLPGEFILEIVDSHGKLCMQVEYFHQGYGVEEFSLDLTDQKVMPGEKGLYFIRIHNSEQSLHGKFIVL